MVSCTGTVPERPDTDVTLSELPLASVGQVAEQDCGTTISARGRVVGYTSYPHRTLS
jgi:hypothetical protein